mmetsp:Transcript_76357/g.192181  ORF Transcript_76357/g.192181 Transcript_76357/m.192181 type:complete len:411 (+) Transcript_76357:58-1290(+)
MPILISSRVMSSPTVLRLAVAALFGFHARAELQAEVDIPSSVVVADLANTTSPVEQPQQQQQQHQQKQEAQSLVASSPFWCQFVPDAFKSTACGGQGPSSTPPPSSAMPSPAQCQQMSAEQQAKSAACTYSEKEAVQFAALSAAAYCNPEGWTCGEACSAVPGMTSVKRIDNDELDAHAYVGRLGEACVVVFRGTDSASGWGQDLASVMLTELPGCSHQGKSCMVGSGFLQNYQEIAGDIRAQLSVIGCTKTTPLFVTGHSLGAAMATLAMFDLNRLGYSLSKAYTFGQPRVGDSAFASAFHEAMASTPVHRVTRADDPVVYMPGRDPFHHVGTEIYYRGETTEGYRVCDGSGEDATCQDSNGDGGAAALLMQCVIPQQCGHLRYLQPAMAFPLDGESCARRMESAILIP